MGQTVDQCVKSRYSMAFSPSDLELNNDGDAVLPHEIRKIGYRHLCSLLSG